MSIDNLIDVIKPVLLTKSLKDYITVFEKTKINTKELAGEPVVFTLSDYSYTKKYWTVMSYKSETGLRNVLFNYLLSTGLVNQEIITDFFTKCMTIAGYKPANSIKWVKSKFTSMYDYMIKEHDKLALCKPIDYQLRLRWKII